MFGSVILLAAIGSSCKAPLGGVWSEAESGSKDGCVKQAAALGSQCCVSTPPIPVDPHMNNCGGTRPTGLPFAGRSPVYAQGGMAATSQPLSTQAALDILKAGGSAVDAAIAASDDTFPTKPLRFSHPISVLSANAMEGVVEPMMNGIGGDLMAIVYDPKTKKLKGINSSGRAPKSLSLANIQKLASDVGGNGFIPTKGPLAVSVPGAVMGWCMLHEKFGTLPFAEVLAPAIKYATQGFPVSPVIATDWVGSMTQNSSTITTNGQYPHAADGFRETFSIDGKAPRAGQIFKNPDLANTLQEIATGGCDAFYNGSIAEKIAAFAEVGGTHLSKEDMAAHYSEWADPVNSTYRDRYTVFELPPNPQGIAALQMLNILEGYDLKSMGHNSADYLHVHVEAKKLAFADRAKYYADPDFVKVPVQGLINKTYAAERRKLINMTHAAEEVDAGTPAEHSKMFTGDTIYLTTADSNGMMVSLIQSNYEGFGSGLVVPGLGFALQDRGALFSLNASDANVYAPGKRPFHTIIPGFVYRDGEPWLSFGVMGGNMQPQGHAQVLCNIIDFGMNVQEAGDAARYYHTGSSQPTGQVMHDGGEVELEAGVCEAVRADLRARGHTLYAGPNGGGYQAIMLEHDGDAPVYHGASEMRKDGQCAGY